MISTIHTPNITNMTTTFPATTNPDRFINPERAEEQNYQRNFLIIRVTLSSAQKYLDIQSLILQIIVRSVVIITLIVLATAFGVFFLHNWTHVEQSTPLKHVKATT